MPETRCDALRALLNSYRAQMRDGGHPAALPDRILALVRDTAAGDDTPADLQRLIAAAEHYWQLHADDNDPDPLDLEMVNDELIDALYDYYEG